MKTAVVAINVAAGTFNLALIVWGGAGWMNAVVAAVSFMAAGFFIAKPWGIRA